MGVKRKPPVEPKEGLTQLAGRLQAADVLWRIEVPFYARDADKKLTGRIEVNHYPPGGVSLYSFEDAVAVLAIFCNRYTGNRQLPPPAVEPVAIEATERPVDADGRPRPLHRFTLKEVDLKVYKLAHPAVRAEADDEDEADRWLREQDHPEDQQHLDP